MGNADLRYYFTFTRMAISKTVTNVDKDVEKQGPSYISTGNVKGKIPLTQNFAIS
jgi:hypothetical protein